MRGHMLLLPLRAGEPAGVGNLQGAGGALPASVAKEAAEEADKTGAATDAAEQE